MRLVSFLPRSLRRKIGVLYSAVRRILVVELANDGYSTVDSQATHSSIGWRAKSCEAERIMLVALQRQEVEGDTSTRWWLPL